MAWHDGATERRAGATVMRKDPEYTQVIVEFESCVSYGSLAKAAHRAGGSHDGRTTLRRRLLIGALRVLAWCTVGIGASLSGPCAQAAPRTLRVVTDDNYPPFLFLGPSGRPEGYLVDLWKLWQARTGVKVDLEPMQWAAAQRMMHDGRADVIDMIFRTPVRDQLYRFSPPYSTQSVGIYVDHGIHGITGPGSLPGFVIGVERGDACVDKLGSLGLTRLAVFPDYMAILNAAKSGSIKMFCMDDDPANYYLYLLRDQLRFTRAFTLYSGRFHWAVDRGDSATFALVRRGMAMITPGERAALKRKWFSQPLQFRPYLRMVLMVLAGALTVLAVAAAWIGMLRRAVRIHTAELRKDRAQLRTLLESSPDAMWLKDEQGRYLECNARAIEVIGRPRDEVLGRDDAEVHANAELVAAVREVDQRVVRSGHAHRVELQFQRDDGVAYDLEVIKVPIHSADGSFVGLLGVARDITERRRAERETRLAAAAFEGQDGMIVTDAANVIERVNEAFTRISGYTAAEAIGKTPAMLRSGRHDRLFYERLWSELKAAGRWSGEFVNRRKNGELFIARTGITAVTDRQDRLLHFVGSFQDITAERQATQEAEHLKLFDRLTNLPNRTLLDDRIAHAQASSAEAQQFGAVLMIDVDDFQRVNDAFGHGVGDELLVEIARRIRGAAGEGDTVGRFSGDSFVVVAEGLGAAQMHAVTRTIAIAETIRRGIAEPVRVGGQNRVCTASIGATVFLGNTARNGVLLRMAELAMYKSKQRGGDAVRLFEDAMQAEVEARTRLEAELREAIDQQRFVLHYQPQVDSTGRLIGAEALVRWQHPERGLVGPDEFIALAEDTGLIEPIGRWVLGQGCRQLAMWSARPQWRELTLSVNVSTRQFRSPAFVDEVLAEVARFGTQPDRLKLEITESLAIDDVEASVGKLQALRDAGILLSIDDFGTGNSSLSYLTRLPLSQLKIDKSFVDHLPGSASAALVAQAIIAMGDGLGLHVIAEGVETREQREFLAAHGCHAYQGYLFGKPVALEEFERAAGTLADSVASR